METCPQCGRASVTAGVCGFCGWREEAVPMVDALSKHRHPGWPKMCLESWLKSFIRWEQEGGEKTLNHKTLAYIRHSLQCNLLYINELEANL